MAGTIGIIPSNIERRWLQCFAQLYYVVMSRFFSERVGDDRDFPIPWIAFIIFSRPCANHPPDHLDLYLYSAAGREGPSTFTFDILAKSMVDWMNRVSQGTLVYNSKYDVMLGGELVAQMKVVITAPE